MRSGSFLALTAAAIAWAADARATAIDTGPLAAEATPPPMGASAEGAREGREEAREVAAPAAAAGAPGADPAVQPLVLVLGAASGPAPRLDLDLEFRSVPGFEAWHDPLDRPPPAWLEAKGLGVLTGAAVVAMGVIALLPEDISKWKQEDDPWSSMQANFEQAWTQPPVWDRDGWAVNYVGHPMVGMYTYLIPRNMGAGRARSFLFSTVASFGWEYVFEAWAEQPSIQDLLITSTVGSLLGEAVFQLTRALLRGGLRGWEKVVLTVVNPVYVIEHGYR